MRFPEFLLGIGLGRLFSHPPLRAGVARHAGLLASAAALVTHRLVEQPLHCLVRRAFDSRRKARTLPSGAWF